MRVSGLSSIASRALACTAALALAAPMAAAQEGSGPVVPAAAPGPELPLAAVRGQERCKLITAREGEDAQLVEERSPEQAEPFPFLQSQDLLLDDFRVSEDEWRDCGIAFGVFSGTGAQAAVGGIGATTLAGIGVAATAGASFVGLAAVGLVAATVAGGGGGGGTTATTSTTPVAGAE